MLRPTDRAEYLKLRGSLGDVDGGWPIWAGNNSIVASTFRETIDWDDAPCP